MWESNVRRVTPYTPGEQPKTSNLIKLNTNENPYPPAPGVLKALKDMDYTSFRKYPDPTCDLLVSAVSDTYGIAKDRIFTGVGSDDVLAMAFLTFFNGEREILFPDVTYSFYDVWAELFRIPYRQVPLKEDFSIDPEDYKVPNGGLVIANPNAPTGLKQPLSAIEDIVRANPASVVIVDEAYVDFGAESAIPLIDKYENLLVVQTFSKSRSMAGMRVGLAFGQPKLIKYMLDVKYSFNSYTMNMPALILGAEAVRDTQYFEETVAKVVATREWTKKELCKLGFEFADSSTNFIFAKHKTVERDYIFSELRKRNILVRAFNAPRTKDWLRISIGTDEEMRAVIAALEEIIKSENNSV
ncbi:MAG: histidinol-phosphate transaminase [Lachnospiraceae bacterium]|nr:histidinol-phosphate transaminase [Lachnospiraceae bacterium]